jgi:hypothetical protein
VHGVAANPAGHADPEVAQFGQERREEHRAGRKVGRGHAETIARARSDIPTHEAPGSRACASRDPPCVRSVRSISKIVGQMALAFSDRRGEGGGQAGPRSLPGQRLEPGHAPLRWHPVGMGQKGDIYVSWVLKVRKQRHQRWTVRRS